MNTHQTLLESKQQNVDLWEAWIDMQIATSGVATLHVIGDVYTDNGSREPYFIKKEQPGSKILALEIHPASSTGEDYISEIMYAEELQDLDQYSSICIYAGNVLLTRINDIEKIA